MDCRVSPLLAQAEQRVAPLAPYYFARVLRFLRAEMRTGRSARATQQQLSLLPCAVAQKRARKPFAFRTYICKGLELPCNEQLQKNTRGGGPFCPHLPQLRGA